MQELDRKITFRLDKQTFAALDELVRVMNERSKFHVLHTHSDAVRYSIRNALRLLKKEAVNSEPPSSEDPR